MSKKDMAIKTDGRHLESGFWKPGPHLLLEEGFDYPEQSIWLDQYTVIEADGKISVYRNWFQDYTPETIETELQQGGFSIESFGVTDGVNDTLRKASGSAATCKK